MSSHRVSFHAPVVVQKRRRPLNTIRETLMTQEDATLSPLAMHVRNSRGRARAEDPDPIRTDYMRDRDRIIHSKAFRRLKHKTQVYVSPGNDHYRTRLTHTLEVNQIARTVGRALGLNCDLIEAIALAHDVGHTPFAHCGEEVLNRMLPQGFTHNINSVRVLTHIEKHGQNRGLNLTWEVLDGVMHHSGFEVGTHRAATLEGQLIRFCDKIAYVQHDIDDSIRAGLLTEQALPREFTGVLGNSLSERITTLVTDLIEQGMQLVHTHTSPTVAPVLRFSPEIEVAMRGLRQFLFDQIYLGTVCSQERKRAAFIVEFLFNHFKDNETDMPAFYRSVVETHGINQAVVDYISGMTDNFCVALFKDLTIPRSFLSTGGFDAD